MKSTVFVEFSGKQSNDKDLINTAKNIWLEAGNKIRDIETLNLYVKPEENKVYYVINDEFNGNFEFN